MELKAASKYYVTVDLERAKTGLLSGLVGRFAEGCWILFSTVEGSSTLWYITCVWRAVQLHILSGKKKKSTFGSPRRDLRLSRANLGFKNDFISLTIHPHPRTCISKYIHRPKHNVINPSACKPSCADSISSRHELVVLPATSIPPPPPRERCMYITRPHGYERHCPAAYVRLSDTTPQDVKRVTCTDRS
jgi:hypothetical protein